MWDQWIFVQGCLLQTFVKLLPEMMEQETEMYQWLGLILMQLLNFFTFTLYISPIFYILVWLNKFSSTCKMFDHQSHLYNHHCRKCIEMFKSIKRALSFPFLYIFAFCQLFIIANCFNIISTGLMEKYSSMQKILMSISFFCIALHLILIVLLLTLSVEQAFEELKSLAISLKDNAEGIIEGDKA